MPCDSPAVRNRKWPIVVSLSLLHVCCLQAHYGENGDRRHPQTCHRRPYVFFRCYAAKDETSSVILRGHPSDSAGRRLAASCTSARWIYGAVFVLLRLGAVCVSDDRPARLVRPHEGLYLVQGAELG